MIIVKLIPIILLLGIIAFIIFTVLKGNKSSAFYYAITILFISGMLYYMIVFLDYEILGTYSLTNLNKYDKQLLEAKENLDSLDIKKKQILTEINKAKSNLEVQLDKIVVYTKESAKTTLEMQSHLERLKEIEKTINEFDTKLSRIAQDLISFSFILGEKPVYWDGKFDEKYKQQLKDYTKSLSQLLKFDADSLFLSIYKTVDELNKK